MILSARHLTGLSWWMLWQWALELCGCCVRVLAETRSRSTPSPTNCSAEKKLLAGVGNAKSWAHSHERTGAQTPASRGTRIAHTACGRRCETGAATPSAAITTATEGGGLPCANGGKNLKIFLRTWAHPPQGSRSTASTTMWGMAPRTAGGRPVSSKRTTQVTCTT